MSESNEEPVKESPSIDIVVEDNQNENKEKEQVVTPRTEEKLKRAEFLGNGPLIGTLWKMTYPDFIAKIISALYTLVDSMFVGQYSGSTVEETKNNLAGLSFASPIEMCLMVGLSLIFAQGGGPLYGRYLGKHDEITSRRIIGNVFTMDILLGITMAIVLPLCSEWLLTLMGASWEAGTMRPALDYIIPIMIADILYNICYATNNLMRGEGAAMYTCALMTISSLTNIVFDFIFLKVFGIGIEGAAYATIIAYIFSSSFGLWYFLSKRSAVTPTFSDMKPDWKLVCEIMNVGLPGMVIGFANGILTIVSNRLVIGYSPYDAIDPRTVAANAAAGSLAKMQHFLFIPINSIAHGVVAMLSYCRGAKLYDRFVKAMRCCFIGQFVICIVLSIFCFVFAEKLALMFNSDEEFIRLFSEGLRYMSLCLFLSPCSCALYPGLQAIGRGALSAVVLMGRSCIFIVIAELVMCGITKDYMGVFHAYPIAEIVSALFAGIVYIFVRKDLHGKKELPKNSFVCSNTL